MESSVFHQNVKQSLSENKISAKEDCPTDEKSKFKITVEPTVFLTMLAIAYQMVTTSNLLIQRICRVTFQFPVDVCNNYTSYSNASDFIQSKSTDLIMYKNLIETIPAVVFSLFLGAWSDRHGRKPPILFAQVGFLSSTIFVIVFVYFEYFAPEYLLISSLFVGCFGGFVAFVLGSFSLVSDLSTPENRTKRIVIVDLALFMALPIGLILSGLMENRWGFQSVYATSAGLYFIAIVYTYFVVPDTVKPSSEDKFSAFRDLFLIQNVENSVKMLCKIRTGHRRIYIFLLLVTVAFVLMPVKGESEIMFLFVQQKFNWEQKDLSYYNAAVISFDIIGMSIIFKLFLPKFKISDLLLALVGIAGIIIKEIIFVFSVKEWMLYFGAFISFFQFISLPILRSFLSKIIDVDEIGIIFAVISSVEAVVPLLVTIIYPQLYKITRNVFPAAVFAFSGSAMIVPLLILAWIFIDNRKSGLSDKYNERNSLSPSMKI